MKVSRDNFSVCYNVKYVMLKDQSDAFVGCFVECQDAHLLFRSSSENFVA